MSAVGKAFVEVYDVVIAGPVLSQFTQSVHLVIDETDLDQGCPNPGPKSIRVLHPPRQKMAFTRQVERVVYPLDQKSRLECGPRALVFGHP